MSSPERSVADLRAQIAEVDKAIAAARTGASYSIGGRTLTRQDLDSLRNERTQLVRDLRAAEAVLQGAQAPGVMVASWHR